MTQDKSSAELNWKEIIQGYYLDPEGSTQLVVEEATEVSVFQLVGS